MADFKIAYQVTMQHEGAYANNPLDAGGETYKGISRRFHPSWEGWFILDLAKGANKDFPICLSQAKYSKLNSVLVPQFYKALYWDCFIADEIPWQSIADELFDTGVNMGVQRATLFLQRSLNILKMRHANVATNELVVDGKFGPKTFNALLSLEPHYEDTLYKLLNIMQGNHYLHYIEQDGRQATFLIGWLKRIQIQHQPPLASVS